MRDWPPVDVIDRSGSMASIRGDMVGGLSTMLADRAAKPGLLTVDVVTFDDQIELAHTMADASSIASELEPRGSPVRPSASMLAAP